jgi:hypothetical protein
MKPAPQNEQTFSTGHVAFGAAGSWLNPTVHQLKMPLEKQGHVTT